MDDDCIVRSRLYKHLCSLMNESNYKEKLEQLVQKYGQEEVRWMLQVIREDIQLGANNA